MSETRTGERRAVRPHFSVARLLRQDDVVGGGAMILIAAFLAWVGRHYSAGTLSAMGPGYLPRALCWIVGAMGVAIVVNGYRKGFPHAEGEIEETRILPLLIVIAAFVFFAFASEVLGLLLTAAIFAIVVSYAHPKRSLVEAILLMVGLLVLVFALWELIGIQLPLLPRFL